MSPSDVATTEECASTQPPPDIVKQQRLLVHLPADEQLDIHIALLLSR